MQGIHNDCKNTKELDIYSLLVNYSRLVFHEQIVLAICQNSRFGFHSLYTRRTIGHTESFLTASSIKAVDLAFKIIHESFQTLRRFELSTLVVWLKFYYLWNLDLLRMTVELNIEISLYCKKGVY